MNSITDYITQKMLDDIKSKEEVYRPLMTVFHNSEDALRSLLFALVCMDEDSYKTVIDVVVECGKRIDALEDARNELVRMVREMLRP